jgi:hypothetical protein
VTPSWRATDAIGVPATTASAIIILVRARHWAMANQVQLDDPPLSPKKPARKIADSEIRGARIFASPAIGPGQVLGRVK